MNEKCQHLIMLGVNYTFIISWPKSNINSDKMAIVFIRIETITLQ